jgi:hypothetical protein
MLKELKNSGSDSGGIKIFLFGSIRKCKFLIVLCNDFLWDS